MSSFQPSVRDPVEEASFCVAVTEHVAKNIEAVADSIVAVLYSAGDANRHLVYGATQAFGSQLAAATVWVSARPQDLLQTQQALARRAVEQYAANARALGRVLLAGAKASREPLLERLR
jgi:hypothetical protein